MANESINETYLKKIFPNMSNKDLDYEGWVKILTQNLYFDIDSLKTASPAAWKSLEDKGLPIRFVDVLKKTIGYSQNSVVITELKPEDFTISVDDLSNFININCHSKLIDVEKVIEHSLKIIMNEVGNEGDHTDRVPPLMFQRLQRGGKTTVLMKLYDALKKQNYSPIIITFNKGFSLREGESQLQGLLRAISFEFVEKNRYQYKYISCSEMNVINHIKKSSKPVVLLIDELNSLSESLNPDICDFLKENFLDMKNRYLIFSTHIFLNVEPPLPSSSKRSIRYGIMPLCNDEKQLQLMDNCSEINPLHVAMLGGIPSLLFSFIKEGNLQNYFDNGNFNLVFDDEVLVNFVNEMVNGKFHKKDVKYRQFDRFASVDYVNRTISWPLIYVRCILDNYSENHTIAATIVKFIDKLNASLTSYQSGIEWEYIIHISILFRFFHCHLGKSGVVPFLNYEFKKKNSFSCVMLKSSIVDIGKAFAFMKLNQSLLATDDDNDDDDDDDASLLHSYCYFIPTNASLQQFDGFLRYVGSKKTTFLGIQMKLGIDYPTEECPDWMDKGVLICGKAKTTTRQNRFDKWKYLTESEVHDLLLPSFIALYPNNWNSGNNDNAIKNLVTAFDKLGTNTK